MDQDGLFGHVNDSIRGLATEGPLNEIWEFVCECSDVRCHEMVSLTLLEFDARRAASPPAPVLAEHESECGRQALLSPGDTRPLS